MSSSMAEKSETALDIMKNWFVNSPSHGIRRVGRSKTFLERLIWLYIFWVFTVLMGTFIAMVVIKYIDNPTKIHLSMRHYHDPIHFPAVTICNINPLRDDGFLNDIRKSRLPGGGSSPFVSESEYRKAVAAYIDRILNAQVNGRANPLVEWGYQLNDLLITCVFNSQLCVRNLTQLFHPNYGNCYTFDNDLNVHGEETNNIRHDWSTDDHSGDNNYKLFLELYLHQNEYNAYLDSRAAFRIFIHRKHEVPILSQNSVFLGPNKYTKLIFSQRIMSFSRQCRNELTDHMKQIFTNKVRYTQALCYKLCEQRLIEQQCKCIEPTLAVFYQFFSNKCEKYQATTNISLCSIYDECLTTRNYSDSRELCQECLPECEIIQYSVESSYANYPNLKASGEVLQRVRNHFRFHRRVNTLLNKSQGASANRNAELRGNIVAVEITASPYATEILTESPVYTWVDLISSIGGQTGLWIGVTLISFVEIVELFYLLLDRFYSYFLSKNK